MELTGTNVARKRLESGQKSVSTSSVSVCVFMLSFVSSAKQVLTVRMMHFGS